MSNGVIVHTNQISRMAGVGQKVLKDGSSVLVRVIADKGNGKYEGSVAGVRVNITSAKNLSVGSTFVASITTKNGTIYVTPQNHDISFDNSFEISSANLEKITNLLNSLNLPPDTLSYNLLQQMKQLEMKLEPSLLGKIHNTAVKVRGKEKLVSELLTLLADKDIFEDETAVFKLLAYLESLDDDFEGSSESNDESKKLLNKINCVEGGWFLIPFDLIRLNMEERIGGGIIRVLIDKNNQLKMLNISCGYKEKDYLFSLEYQEKKLKTVRMNVNDENTNSEITRLKKLFMAVGIETAVIWCEREEIEGNASATEEIYSVKGSV